MTAAGPLLEARGLSRSYGRHRALVDVDLVVDRGEVLGLLGLNGAGKSTTLQILAGALAPDAGEVRIGGCSLAGEPLAAKARLGYLPETPPLVPDMLVDEYLGWCATLRGVPRARLGDALAGVRAQCGLADVGRRVVRHLSKGYQQRVGIAQAIVHDPALVILDEPTSGLDPRQIRDVRELIRTLGRERALIVSTHILPEVKLLAGRIVILHQGRIVYDAPVDARAPRLRARFRTDPDAAAIAAVAGVTGAERGPDGAWAIAAEEPATAAPAIAEHAVASGWGLLELAPDEDPLERVFMRLTSGAGPAEAESVPEDAESRTAETAE